MKCYESFVTIHSPACGDGAFDDDGEERSTMEAGELRTVVAVAVAVVVVAVVNVFDAVDDE